MRSLALATAAPLPPWRPSSPPLRRNPTRPRRTDRRPMGRRPPMPPHRRPMRRRRCPTRRLAGPLAGTGTAPGYVVPPFNEIGTGQSLPTSNQASNIDSADTRSLIAPRLPTPPVGEDAPFRAYLSSARQALASGQTGVAQEALERAETRLLDRSVAPSQVNDPIAGPVIQRLGQARHAIAAGDFGGAIGLIDSILAAGPPRAVSAARIRPGGTQ